MEIPDLCFSWDEHENILAASIQELCENNCYTDCTLVCEGAVYEVHKALLSSCSPFLSSLLQDCKTDHPVITLDGISPVEVQVLIEYIYKGEVHIPQEWISSFFDTTKEMGIVGLSQDTHELSEMLKENLENYVKEEIIEEEEDSRVILSDITSVDVRMENTSQTLSEENDFFFPSMEIAADNVEKETTTEDSNLYFYIKKDKMGNSYLQKSTPQRRRSKITEHSENKIKGKSKPDEIHAIEEIDANNKKIYKCSKCGNKYSHRRTLLHHIHWICDQPATYACYLCSYMGKRKFQLKSHLRHAHSIHQVVYA